MEIYTIILAVSELGNCNVEGIVFIFNRLFAIKQIALDPRKKTKTKEAVLKEAR